jgi:hypothetical protein
MPGRDPAHRCGRASRRFGNHCRFFPLYSGQLGKEKLDEEDCNGDGHGRRSRRRLRRDDLARRSSLAGGWGPGIAGGLIAGAVIGGLASSAYGWGPGYGYYDGPAYYGAGYYGGPYAYDDGYDAPYRWGGYATRTYYSAPVSYGYRYRRVVSPAYAYYGGAYPVVRHRWHHHW